MDGGMPMVMSHLRGGG